MSLTPPPPVTRRDWTLPIIAGVVAIVVVLAVCLVGSAATFMSLRGSATPQTDASGTPAPPPSGSAARCLVGDWLETSFVTTVEIYGTAVQLTGKGTLSRYAPDGTVTIVLENVVYSGSAGGDTFEVVHNGSLQMNYVADDTTIRYSNPITVGTTTWKVNGTVRGTEKIEASVQPETYKCQGNQLRLLGDESAAELQRLGTPTVPI